MSLDAEALLFPGILGVMAVVFGGIGIISHLLDSRPTIFTDWFARTLSKKRSSESTLITWVARTFMFVGVVFLAASAGSFYREISVITGWPEVTGTVTRSGVHYRGWARSPYQAWYELSYQSRGRTYVTPTSAGVWFRDRSVAEHDSAHFTRGTTHPVRVSPEHPEIIRVDVEPSFWYFFPALMPLGGALVFAFFGWAVGRFLRTDLSSRA